MNHKRADLREINLSLTVDEVNVILEAVGRLPFRRVYQLIGKLQQQASQQLTGSGANGASGNDIRRGDGNAE